MMVLLHAGLLTLFFLLHSWLHNERVFRRVDAFDEKCWPGK